MWGIPTMKRLNDEAAEGRAIMKEAGHDLPVIESTPEARAAESHTYTPLPAVA